LLGLRAHVHKFPSSSSSSSSFLLLGHHSLDQTRLVHMQAASAEDLDVPDSGSVFLEEGRELTPKEIVSELDLNIIGQDQVCVCVYVNVCVCMCVRVCASLIGCMHTQYVIPTTNTLYLHQLTSYHNHTLHTTLYILHTAHYTLHTTFYTLQTIQGKRAVAVALR
jgi:hypothetical protein